MRVRRLMAIFVLGLVSAACAPPTPLPTATPTETAIPPTPAPTATATPLPVLRLGALFDISGATSELAAPYVDAIRTRLALANASGGVTGRRIELIEADYGHDVVRAVDAYKRLAGPQDVAGIIGWASADADALSPMLAGDQLPYFSASHADILIERPAASTYNFLLGATYADQVHALYQYVKDSWKVSDREPSVALVFADDTFGRSPIVGARANTGRFGIKVADEQALPPATQDAAPYLRSVQAKAADFVLVNAYPPLAAAIAKGAAQIGLKAPLLLLNWATSEDLIALAGTAAENAVGATPFAFAAEERPGFAGLKTAYAARGLPVAILNTRHVQGWLNAGMMLEGIRRAGRRVSGETIKRGLETVRDYDTGGVTAPITWTAEQHAGSRRVKLYQVKNGRWTLLAEP